MSRTSLISKEANMGNECIIRNMCPTRTTLVAFTMLRKGSELKKDKEILLDLDNEGSVKSYGSLQNGSSHVPKSVRPL